MTIPDEAAEAAREAFRRGGTWKRVLQAALPFLAPQWRPIEEARKDPECFLLVFDSNPEFGGIALASWQGDRWYGVDHFGLIYDSVARRSSPTHFLPLPSPPEDRN